MRLDVVAAVLAVVACCLVRVTSAVECFGTYYVEDASTLAHLQTCELLEGDIILYDYYFPGLTNLSFPVLSQVKGELYFSLPSNLVYVSLPVLESVTELTLYGKLSVSVPKLTFANELDLEFTQLGSFDMSALHTVEQLDIDSSMSPPPTIPLPALTVVKRLWAEAVELDWPSLASARTLYLESKALCNFPGLKTARNIYVSHATSVTLQALQRVQDTLSFTSITQSGIELPSLTDVGALYVDECSNTQSFSAPELQFISVARFSSSGLTSISLPALQVIYPTPAEMFASGLGSSEGVYSMLQISNCPVAKLDLHSLQAVSGLVEITATELTDASAFSSLRHADQIDIQENENLKTLNGLQALLNVFGQLTVSGNGLVDISSIVRSSLNVDSNVDLTNNPSLCVSQAQKLKSTAHIGGVVYTAGCLQTC